MPQEKYSPYSEENSDCISRGLCGILALHFTRYFNFESIGIILCLQTQGQHFETDAARWDSRRNQENLTLVKKKGSLLDRCWIALGRFK